jgi:hypothetical protein
MIAPKFDLLESLPDPVLLLVEGSEVPAPPVIFATIEGVAN